MTTTVILTNGSIETLAQVLLGFYKGG